MTVGLIESNGRVTLLVLNAKLNLMWKNSGNLFLGHLAKWFYHVFPMLHSIMGVPPIYFKVFMDHVTIFNSSRTQSITWSSL